MNKIHNGYAWLYNRRIVQGKSIEEMAAEAKVSTNTIRRRLTENNIK